MSIRRESLPWPPGCCVPAFLGQAVTAFSGRPDRMEQDEIRKVLSRLLGVRLAPGVVNPWNLPVSGDRSDRGVTPETAKRLFPQVQELLQGKVTLDLDIVDINKVAFELYEDEVLALVSRGSIVGIGFDHSELLRHRGNWDSPTSEYSPHLVRLTPLAEEVRNRPNVLSAEFGADYQGNIWIFDDSCEMDRRDSPVSWGALLRACRSMDGAFWAVRPLETAPPLGTCAARPQGN
jgi:hypothetical protein